MDDVDYAALAFDAPQIMDGLKLLRAMPERSAKVVFLDPQYRDVLDKLDFGNEGERQKGRALLPQMTSEQIAAFVEASERALDSSGHLFLWMDKFALVSGNWERWLPEITPLAKVDMITWDKRRMGQGKRSRRVGEHLVVLQKGPRRAEGVWLDHKIRDVWPERAVRGGHPHKKPQRLLRRLIRCVTKPGDLVVDPAAGSYATLEACRATGRRFLGCDLIAP